MSIKELIKSHRCKIGVFATIFISAAVVCALSALEMIHFGEVEKVTRHITIPVPGENERYDGLYAGWLQAGSNILVVAGTILAAVLVYLSEKNKQIREHDRINRENEKTMLERRCRSVKIIQAYCAVTIPNITGIITAITHSKEIIHYEHRERVINLVIHNLRGSISSPNEIPFINPAEEVLNKEEMSYFIGIHFAIQNFHKWLDTAEIFSNEVFNDDKAAHQDFLSTVFEKLIQIADSIHVAAKNLEGRMNDFTNELKNTPTHVTPPPPETAPKD
ncbi:hypothetical protein [Niveispirillum sp.]|uniref:hypothetical protein n=1 Tax=Niveispirillum sp. TaxID=1917217 RepID=UPI001B75FDF1|nr:hypothetical protein [Niveispirillum sp.]MBP7337695.1 hypothetical protein [Niveispirillum sp.]